MKAMELEIDSNINSTHSSSSIIDIVQNSKQVPNKKSLNLDSIIKALIEKYSLKEVIESIIHTINPTKKSKEKAKENSELDSRINEICQMEGAIKMIQVLIQLKNVKKNRVKKASVVSNEEKEKEKFIEIGNNNKEKEKNNNPINSINKRSKSNENIVDVIRITDEDSKNSGKINNNNNNNITHDNIIIEIDDNYLGNNENKVENEEKIDLNDKKLNNSNYLEITSNNDHSNKKGIITQPKKVYDPSKVFYHCSIIEGIYYKYIKEYIKEKEIIFICINPKCKAWGIYDLEDKTFRLMKEHYNGKSIFCCKKYMTDQDERNKKYMIKNKVYENIMYKDENDEI